ncbi:MAG: hypothetical protein OJF60_002161 [Burkholderiaceae bacterium]|jgi:outer membrane protein TolC|nr:MAG: hypothetical protein OJF60_002161 [Burkholderiaceae bacterium]
MHWISQRPTRALSIAAIALGIGGCATYSPKPLPTRPALAQAVSPLTVELDPRLPLARHTVDASHGLDSTDVAILAVANNPDLKLARDAAGVAHAQAFAAGLLPDPQLSLTRDFPTNGGPSNVSAFNLGLGYDITALLAHATTAGAAKAGSRKANLDLLWQEWQVISRARTLFVGITEQEKMLEVLNGERNLFATQYERSRSAEQQGNMTLSNASQQFAALQDIDRRINDQQRQIAKSRHELNALLGLAPDVELPLRGDAQMPALTFAAVRAALARLPQCRPDLLALQAGYQGQEERLHGAVIAQFPSLTIGITRTRDTSNLYSNGFGITINLPIFNRNRGNIAIETATRQQLYDEYQNRLNGADSDTQRLLADRALMQRQLTDTRRGVTELERVVRQAQRAYDAGNLDILAYTALRGALLNKRIEALSLQQSILEADVALQTLVGCGTAATLPQTPEKKP